MLRRGILGVVALVAASCAQPSPRLRAPADSKPAPVAQIALAVDPSGEWELRWDRTFTNWKPPIFNGKLSIEREGAHWISHLAFRESSAVLVFESLRMDGDRIEIVFIAPMEDGSGHEELTLSGWIRENRLIAEMRWGKTIGWTPVGGRRVVLPAFNHASVDHSLPPNADMAHADLDALTGLLERANAERSSALVIVKDGKIGLEMYREGYDGGPLVAMAASKSIVSLAIGMLIAEGRLRSTRRWALFCPSGRSSERSRGSPFASSSPIRRGSTLRARILRTRRSASTLSKQGSCSRPALDFSTTTARSIFLRSSSSKPPASHSTRTSRRGSSRSSTSPERAG